MKINSCPRLVLLVGVAIVTVLGGTAMASEPKVGSARAVGAGTQSVTKTLTTVADAYIRNLSPSSNYGGNTSLMALHWYDGVGSNEVTYPLVRFNLAVDVPAGAIIESATLKIYLDAIGNLTGLLPVGLGAYPITSSWFEGGVTWYGQPSVGPSEVTAPINYPAAAWKAWPITEMVRAWHANPAENYGVELRGPSVGAWDNYYLYFNSREEGPGPLLEVTYRVASPTSTPTRTPTRKPSPRPSSTPPAPSDCRNLLTNGDFESGQLPPWNSFGPVWVGGGRQGSQGAFLGGQAGEVAEILQHVFIPTQLGASTLRFWWRAEATQVQPEDHLVAWVEQGSHFENLVTLPASGPLNKWRKVEVDLPASFRGWVSLGLVSVNDQSVPTTFRVDDVELLSCGHFLNLPLILR